MKNLSVCLLFFFGILLYETVYTLPKYNRAAENVSATHYFNTSMTVSDDTVASIKQIDVPGIVSDYHGFVRYDFKHKDRYAIIVTPHKVATGIPWIWRARFFAHEPQTDLALLKNGFHLVYIDVAGLYGSPQAVAIWNEFYAFLTDSLGFCPEPALEGLSRGGLIIYNWAIQNPDKVACIYGDAPVCDLKSWPGPERQEMMQAYGFDSREAFFAYKGNPVDNLAPLAAAGVPILHVVGDADEIVPVSENTAVVERCYRRLGGAIKVIHKPGVGHHPHSLADPTSIVEFILQSADCHH
jgi:pimeloyl-ACP methyl ester carboxylesterase